MVQQPETFPFMVIGNKCDLGDDARVVDVEQAKKFVKDLGDGIEHIETSAKDNTNVAKAFTALAQKALIRQQQLQKKSNDDNPGKSAAERERLR